MEGADRGRGGARARAPTAHGAGARRGPACGVVYYFIVARTYHLLLPLVTHFDEATDEFQTIFKSGFLEASEDPRHPNFLDANFALFDHILHRPRTLQVHPHKDPWPNMRIAIMGRRWRR